MAEQSKNANNKRKSSDGSDESSSDSQQDSKKPCTVDDLIFLNSAGKPVRVSRNKMHAHKGAPIGNEKTRTVVAAVQQALQGVGNDRDGNTLSAMAVARIAAEVYRRNLIYCDGQWHFSAATASAQVSDDFCQLRHNGMGQCETLVSSVGSVLTNLINRFERDQATLMATFARIDDSREFVSRVARHLQGLLQHDESI